MDHLRARFYDHAQLDVQASQAAGHSVYKDVVMVELTVIGSKNESISKPATDELREEFPREWAEYKGERFTDADLTPLTVLEGFTVARQREFEGLGIRSVQDLANVSDGNVQRIREGITLKTQAIKWLEGAELARRDVTVGQVEDMMKRLQLLEEENAKLSANQRQKPGRKKVEDGEVSQAAM